MHSNTGAFTFAALLAVCPSLRPAAVVWDSAPAWSVALEPALLQNASASLKPSGGGGLLKSRHLLSFAGTAAMQVLPPAVPHCFIVTLQRPQLVIAPYIAVPMTPALTQAHP